ncbi:MAG TPA: fibronectin type III domain-containing protein [Bacillus bacterium]|nr:fibronectin type III domain-containing protein [Bacillus sp. (in: firmicutes)]
MKKLSVVLAAVLMLAVMPVAASASNYGFKQGDYVKLNGYRFIVLDPEADYMFADFMLENRAFDTNNNTKYNPSNNNNIANYLNNTFLNNLGDLSNYVKTHSWFIGIEKNEKSIVVDAKIGMVSYSEANKYISLIGPSVRDKVAIWTLTPRSGLTFPVLWVVGISGGFHGTQANGTNGVRPTFYLEAGLFKSGKGSLSNPYVLSTEQIIILSDIRDLSLLNTTYKEITLSWKNPSESNFSHLNIYQDGNLIKENFTNETYTFKDLNHSQKYKFTIKAVDAKGNETEGISIVVSTDDVPLVPEVQKLNATTKHDRINLSWKNPESEFFHHVKIYRRTEQVHTPTAVSQSSKFEELLIGKVVLAAETGPDFDPMFETNGTFWNDLTVEPSTTYGYKLTTENIAGAESEGVIIQATTLAEPLPEMGGGKIEKEENGDFKLTWTSPTKGKVKILVDNKEYKIVDASLKEYVIPATDMVYDFLGKPKVKLVAIAEDGKEGKPSNPPVNNGGGGGSVGVNIPDSFTANELLKTVMALITWVGPFILLALAIRFAPRIIRFLKGVLAKYKGGKYRL